MVGVEELYGSSVHDDKATWVKRYKAGDIAGAHKAFVDWRNIHRSAATEGARSVLEIKWSGDGTTIGYTRVKSNGTPEIVERQAHQRREGVAGFTGRQNPGL